MSIEYKQGDLCHFEIPVQDKDRAKAFYGEVFGWKFNDVPQMDYTLFETPGRVVNGGFLTPGKNTPDRPVTYLTVDSIDATLKKIEQYGGKALTPKIDVPGQGSLVHLLDSEGNLIAIWQNAKK